MRSRHKSHAQNTQMVRKIHRVTGVIVAIMLLIVSFTGIILNHAEDIDLDGYVPSFFAGIYFKPANQVTGYVVNERYFYVLSEELYVDTSRVRYCGSQLGGVAAFEYGYQVLCDGSILWLDQDLNIVDWVTEAAGVPGDLRSIANALEGVLAFDGNKTYLVDIETPAFATIDVEYPKSTPVQVPADVLMAESVSWHKLILDFHSGRVFGALGKYASDLLALAFILMAITGLMIWGRRTKK